MNRGESESEARFDVYGLPVGVSGDWPEVLEALRRDFAWFPPTTAAPEVTVSIARRPADLTRFGPLEARRVTWRSAEYRDRGRTIVDYLGHAVSVEDGRGDFTIEGSHGWIVWRASHEFILDRVGAHLDRLGLTRVNGLGLAGANGATVVVLESGGGKTTLALRALADGVGVVSEGSPLLDGTGLVHPFPLPLLVRTTSPEAGSLPDEHVRQLHGIDPDPLTLELAAFADLVPRKALPLRNVVFCARSLRREPQLARSSWTHDGPAFARVTMGGFRILYGGGLREAPSRLWRARPRVAAFRAAVRNARPWRLTLGLDKDANWNALTRLL